MWSRFPSLSGFSESYQRLFLNKFVQILKDAMIPLEVVAPDGRSYSTGLGDIRYRILIRDKKFFKALMSPDAFSLGEAYVKGYFDVAGSIRELYEQVWDKILSTDQPKRLVERVGAALASKREKEKENIEYHYDAPSSFYRIFLGETMGYTCGYYPSADASMSDAQNEKMDIICRKLRLQPGEHLLDIGCGWGNFAVYAAKHYRVRVTGITLSREQKAYAEDWIESQGLSSQIDIRIMNYRDLEGQCFDKISCIGMSEHVGRSNMKIFYGKVLDALKPEGLFLQHTITTNVRRKKRLKNAFLDTYMFPGGELLPQQDLVDMASGSGFELLNAENFRLHYVRTLEDWIARMEHHRDRLLKIVSESVYRIYHVFFIGSMVSFQQGEISLYQNLFYKPPICGGENRYFLSLFSKNETRLE
ncbi:MAG: cyclopropane-fatty-acyl-phospholipid synthase family protein [Desulfobacterales bacterium]|nr:cyclopropane-fatty-acyl-phospholipid synthase family protein [Desulfobacterales bacterium]